MDKTTKRGIYIALSIVTIIVGILLYLIFFINQFTSTYPHLKDYYYPLTVKQLETKIIKVLKSDTCFKYIITDSTGTRDDRNYYMTIDHNLNNTSISYHITYSNNDKSTSSLGLVGVFDKTNKSGGYLNEDKDVPKLIGIFDQKLIEKINKNQY